MYNLHHVSLNCNLRTYYSAIYLNYLTLFLFLYSDQTSFDLSHVTRISSSPSQNGNNATYNLFVTYPSRSGPVPRNLLAGILSSQLATINDVTELRLLVQTSSAAYSPPEATTSQTKEAVLVVASNLQANQVRREIF